MEKPPHQYKRQSPTDLANRYPHAPTVQFNGSEEPLSSEQLSNRLG